MSGGRSASVRTRYLAKVASWYEAWGVSELEIAGWLFGEPVKVIRGEQTGLADSRNFRAGDRRFHRAAE